MHVAGDSRITNGAGGPAHWQEKVETKVQAAQAAAPDAPDGAAGTPRKGPEQSLSGVRGGMISAGTQTAPERAPHSGAGRVRGLLAALTPTKRARSPTAQQQPGAEPISVYQLVSRVLPRIKTSGGSVSPLQGSGARHPAGVPSGETPAKKRSWLCACYS